jgi:hypothetical protein
LVKRASLSFARLHSDCRPVYRYPPRQQGAAFPSGNRRLVNTKEIRHLVLRHAVARAESFQSVSVHAWSICTMHGDPQVFFLFDKDAQCMIVKETI